MTPVSVKLRLGALALAFALTALAVPAASQAPRPQAAEQGRPNAPGRPGAEQRPGGGEQGRPSGGEQARPSRPDDNVRKLPADVTTDQTLELPGRSLSFKATAGSIPLLDAESGALQAEIAYTAFTLDAPGRPVTFAFNGGPGAASAYLNIGAMGPWRLPLDQPAPSLATALVPNAETWLDFTDLVFIDPVGTGYSRTAASGDGPRRQFWSIDGDADANAVLIRKWVEKNERQRALKFIVGESYGGFRAPKVARALQDSQGIGVRGLVLISPVLDFAAFGQRRHAPLSWVSHLPSMAAAAADAKGGFDRDALREVEAYATGDYLRDLMRGERDAAAVARIVAKVAAVTGLDPALVRRLGGRIDTGTFQREIHRERGLVGSAYDPAVTSYDPTPQAATSHFPDPVLELTKAPITSAMTDLYQRVLHWRVDQPYRLLEGEVSRRWNWGGGRSPPQVVDDVRGTLADDRFVRIMVAHGASDLITPYFANQMILDQLPVFGSADRVKLAVYPGGHMFYMRDASRRALHADAAAMYRAAVEEGGKE